MPGAKIGQLGNAVVSSDNYGAIISVSTQQRQMIGDLFTRVMTEYKKSQSWCQVVGDPGTKSALVHAARTEGLRGLPGQVGLGPEPVPDATSEKSCDR